MINATDLRSALGSPYDRSNSPRPESGQHLRYVAGRAFLPCQVLGFRIGQARIQCGFCGLNAGETSPDPLLYLSPEQALEEVEPDARSDIYSLGAIMYFLLTGRGQQPIQVILAHANQNPTPPSEMVVPVPKALGAVVLRCLEKSPSDRYQSVAHLRQALHECADIELCTAQDAKAWWHSRTEMATINDLRDVRMTAV